MNKYTYVAIGIILGMFVIPMVLSTVKRRPAPAAA